MNKPPTIYLNDDLPNVGPCGESVIDFTHDAISPVMVTSPGWPEYNYPNKVECRWFVVANKGYRVMMTLVDFSIQDDWDYMQCVNDDDTANAFITLTG